MASIVMALLLVSAIVAPGPPQFPSRTARTARAVVQWLSDHSYLIYLVHPLMMRLLWLTPVAGWADDKMITR
jgi:peptidoglycan/LPS O-acetylase OafA/YrhL